MKPISKKKQKFYIFCLKEILYENEHETPSFNIVIYNILLL